MATAGQNTGIVNQNIKRHFRQGIREPRDVGVVAHIEVMQADIAAQITQCARVLGRPCGRIDPPARRRILTDELQPNTPACANYRDVRHITPIVTPGLDPGILAPRFTMRVRYPSRSGTCRNPQVPARRSPVAYR